MADRENPLEIPENCLKNLGSRVKIKALSGNLKHTFYFRPKYLILFHYYQALTLLNFFMLISIDLDI